LLPTRRARSCRSTGRPDSGRRSADRAGGRSRACRSSSSSPTDRRTVGESHASPRCSMPRSRCGIAKCVAGSARRAAQSPGSCFSRMLPPVAFGDGPQRGSGSIGPPGPESLPDDTARGVREEARPLRAYLPGCFARSATQGVIREEGGLVGRGSELVGRGMGSWRWNWHCERRLTRLTLQMASAMLRRL
jgi:hypothetical protein